jgi:hypothetical protein
MIGLFILSRLRTTMIPLGNSLARAAAPLPLLIILLLLRRALWFCVFQLLVLSLSAGGDVCIARSGRCFLDWSQALFYDEQASRV